MVATINGVKVGYTQNGNAYQKSNTGKTVGTAAGLAVIPIAVSKASKKTGLGGMTAIKQFIKNGPGLGDFLHVAATGSELQLKMLELLQKSKSARIGLVVGGAALVAGVYAGLGRLAGAVVDKLIDRGAKKEADRRGGVYNK